MTDPATAESLRQVKAYLATVEATLKSVGLLLKKQGQLMSALESALLSQQSRIEQLEERMGG